MPIYSFAEKIKIEYVPKKIKTQMAGENLEQLEPWCKLEGKIVMVTGASSGLGLELCLDLAKAGCRIVVAAR